MFSEHSPILLIGGELLSIAQLRAYGLPSALPLCSGLGTGIAKKIVYIE